jgi:hypothetical protein
MKPAPLAARISRQAQAHALNSRQGWNPERAETATPVP